MEADLQKSISGISQPRIHGYAQLGGALMDVATTQLSIVGPPQTGM